MPYADLFPYMSVRPQWGVQIPTKTVLIEQELDSNLIMMILDHVFTGKLNDVLLHVSEYENAGAIDFQMFFLPTLDPIITI